MQEENTVKIDIPNSSENLLAELQKMRQNGDGCDITLVTDDGTHIKTHKLVLMASSPHFHKQLSFESSITSPEELTLDNISPEILNHVIDSVYTGKLNVPIKMLESVIQAFDRLLLSNAADTCRQLLLLKQEVDFDQSEAGITNCDVHDHKSKTLTRTKIESDHFFESETYVKKVRKRRNCLDVNQSNKNVKKSKIKIGQPKVINNIESLKVPKLSISLRNGNGRITSKRACKKSKTKGPGILPVCDKSNTVNCRKKSSLKHLQVKLIQGMDKEPIRDTFNNSENEFEDVKLVIDIDEINKDIIKSEINPSSKKDESVCEITKDDTETIDDIRTDFVDEKDKNNKKYNHSTNKSRKTKKLKSLMKTKTKIIGSSAKLKTKFPKKCQFCEKMLSSHRIYCRHIEKEHKGVGTGVVERKIRQSHWPCTVCGRVLTTGVRQACHQYSKHGIPYDGQYKLHACTFEGCKYITASKNYLQIHMTGRHGNVRPHVCEFCGKGFKLPSALVTHVNIHTNKKQYHCDECDLTFNQKGGLDIHVLKHHKGQDSWSELCHLCSDKFLQKAELCWHMYTAHQIPVPERYKVYSCSLCDYQTIRKDKLDRHTDAHDDKRRWVCSVCNKKFVTKSYLNRHMKYHGEKTFKCEYDNCSYACVDQVGLKKHLRLVHTHKNYKPFACTLCTYKTGLRGNLDKHIRTVHNLDVVTKHTVFLKMKFRDRQSGDILNKDGQLIEQVMDNRGDHSGIQTGPEESDNDDNLPSTLVIDTDPGSQLINSNTRTENTLKRTSSTQETSDSKIDQVNKKRPRHLPLPTPVNSSRIPGHVSNLPNYMYNPAIYSLATGLGAGQLQVPYTLPTVDPRSGSSHIPQTDMYHNIDPLQLNQPQYY